MHFLVPFFVPCCITWGKSSTTSFVLIHLAAGLEEAAKCLQKVRRGFVMRTLFQTTPYNIQVELCHLSFLFYPLMGSQFTYPNGINVTHCKARPRHYSLARELAVSEAEAQLILGLKT